MGNHQSASSRRKSALPPVNVGRIPIGHPERRPEGDFIFHERFRGAVAERPMSFHARSSKARAILIERGRCVPPRIEFIALPPFLAKREQVLRLRLGQVLQKSITVSSPSLRMTEFPFAFFF
jgi:hypothetical protein